MSAPESDEFFDTFIGHLPAARQQAARRILREMGDGDTGPLARLLLAVEMHNACAKVQLASFLSVSREHLDCVRAMQKDHEQRLADILNRPDAQRLLHHAAAVPPHPPIDVTRRGWWSDLLKFFRDLKYAEEIGIVVVVLLLATLVNWVIMLPPADYKSLKRYGEIHRTLDTASSSVNAVVTDSGQKVLQVRGSFLNRGGAVIRDNQGNIIGFDIILSE